MNKMLITVVYPTGRMTSSHADCMVTTKMDVQQKDLYNKRNKDFEPAHETRMQCVGRTFTGGFVFEHFAIMTEGDFDEVAMMSIVNEWKELDTTQPLGEWFDCAMLENFARSVIPVPSPELVEKLMSIFEVFEDFEDDNDEIIQ